MVSVSTSSTTAAMKTVIARAHSAEVSTGSSCSVGEPGTASQARRAPSSSPTVRGRHVADAKVPQRPLYAFAMELMLTGDQICADDAARIGLVNRVVPPGTVLDSARAMARM
ncbi:enoyl-CoA hydratase-related protein, partial [Nocardioides sp.]|uniref:enoyl-CoA hydratase-related protein n=1 Tax=Nocardioides sp. TaxID=35761 RepID=UPI0039C9F203